LELQLLLSSLLLACFSPSSAKEPNPTEMVQDPNNGVYIPKTEAIKKTIKGKEYYFSTEQSAEDYINKNQTKTD
jgi:YHS domain-containing protein